MTSISPLHLSSEQSKTRVWPTFTGHSSSITHSSFEELCLHLEASRFRTLAVETKLRLIGTKIASALNRSFRIAPVHRHPHEILQSIFFHVAYEPGDTYPSAYGYPDPTPTFRRRNILRSVCSLWRNLCDATSDFWTSIVFHDGPAFSETQASIEKLRGRSFLLMIDLSRRGVAKNADVLSAIIAPILPQIRAIEINKLTDDATKVLTAFESLSWDHHKVESLSLRSEWAWGGPPMYLEPSRNFFHRFSNLQNLHMEGPVFDWSLSHFRKLVTLKLSRIDVPSSAQLHTLLSQCTRVEEFHLSFCEGGPEFIAAGDHPEHMFRKLTSLALFNTTG
jgi:hypothetical protein